MVAKATAHAGAAEYPHSTLNSTPTCGSHGGTKLHETHGAGQEESGCVFLHLYVKAKDVGLNSSPNSNVLECFL